MQTILFVDDDKGRHERFRMRFLGRLRITHAYNYKEAVDLLKRGEFDYISLDHDLCEQDIMNPLPTEKTGCDIAKFMVANQVKAKMVFIHSLNPFGRLNIQSHLRGGGYETHLCPGIWHESWVELHTLPYIGSENDSSTS